MAHRGKKGCPPEIELSDDDVYEAMKEVSGYLDITPGDFKDLYTRAFRHARERLFSTITAADVMTREVFSVGRRDALRDVAALMAAEKVSGVPVLDEDGRVVGVISEKDFYGRMGGAPGGSFMGVVAECLKGSGCLAVPIRAQRAGDIMTAPAVTVPPRATIREIVTLFVDRKINRVPVVDAAGGLLGIVSRADVLCAVDVRF